jgi:curved DNA-binding protein CbpA
MKDYYAVLGVKRNADSAAIRLAYERKMKTLARRPPAERAAQEREVKEALETLSNPLKREDFDAHRVEIDANVGGPTSNKPLAIAILVVLFTIIGVGYFLTERWASQEAMRAEAQRAAAEREKARQDLRPGMERR